MRSAAVLSCHFCGLTPEQFWVRRPKKDSVIVFFQHAPCKMSGPPNMEAVRLNVLHPLAQGCDALPEYTLSGLPKRWLRDEI